MFLVCTGWSKMCILETDNGPFKYNLFDNYLENFVLWNPLHKMLEQFSKKWYYMEYIGILPIRPYLPEGLHHCEATKNHWKVNEAILEQ